MSASTVSITANTATATRRTPVLAKEKRSNLDYTPTESLGNGAVGDAAATNKASIRAEAIIEKSHVHDTGPVSRKSVSTATEINTTTTQRRTRKVAAPKPEKARWKRVARIFAKQLGALLILAGLIQVTRKVILNTWPPFSPIFSSETEMAFSELERRIAEVDSIVKTTTSSMQVQVELLDKKMLTEVKSLKQEIDFTSSSFQNELKMIESRTESLQKSIGEVNAKSWVSKDELDRVYEELKKGKVDDSALSEINIDQFRSYAREIVEKEIEKHASDGLGRVDYAVASGGAFVMKHSDPYLVGKARNWLPTSFRRVDTNAMKMLSPSFGEPGQCFALKGSNGYVQIRIRVPIVLDAVTLEHVAKSVAYDRSSAPKDCRVSGWLQGDDMIEFSDETEKQLLTEFTYDLAKSNAQTFNVIDSSRSNLVDTIRLDFTSNHGSNSHTCIYRFRVHGHTPDPPVSVMA